MGSASADRIAPSVSAFWTFIGSKGSSRWEEMCKLIVNLIIWPYTFYYVDVPWWQRTIYGTGGADQLSSSTTALHCTAYRKARPNRIVEWWTMLLLTIPLVDTEEERWALSKAKLLLNGGSKVQLLWSGNGDWQRQQTRQGHGWGHTMTPPSSPHTLLPIPQPYPPPILAA